MRTIIFTAIAAVGLAAMSSILFAPAVCAEKAGNLLSTKKVLYVNAYHAGYAWSDSEQAEVEKVLRSAGVQYRVLYMNTKIRKQDEEIKAAAQDVRRTIDEYQPDLVIMSDDNPVKHVLVPWYKNAALPFVFCGVNWDCGHYGLPINNVTGMLEVSLVPQMLATVRPLAKGDRIAILSNDNETDHIEGQMIPKKFNVHWAAEKYVKTFAEWKAAYIQLQAEADIVFLYGTAGIVNWDQSAAAAFIREHTKVPTCSTQYYMKDLVLVGYMKSGEEQGLWAGQTAIAVLKGKSPSNIAVTENKIGRITLNMPLAKKLGIVFPVKLVKQAELVGEF